MTLEDLDRELNEGIPYMGVPIFFPNSSKAVDDILPPPAAKPKTISVPKSLIVKPSVSIRNTYVKENELYKKFVVDWGAIGAGNDVTDTQMEDFANDWLQTNVSHKDELKYIDLVSATKSEILFRFAVERWLYDNFNGTTPTYRPVATLEFPLKVVIPYFFYDNTFNLKHHIESRFIAFISTRKNKLLNSNFSFLKKIDVDMFEFKFDITRGLKGCVVAALRHTVIMGALAIYTSIFFNKKLTKGQEDMVKRSASRFSDTNNLNNFLKKLK